jgi:hypothetical protein
MLKPPLIVAYGIGVDSTAALVGFHNEGIRPDVILTADVGAEKQATYDYLPIIGKWLQDVGFPPVTIVKNVVKDFRHYPIYSTIEENALTNGTLPSLAFGFHSCSLKWKVTPQNKWTDLWQPAIDCWQSGGQVRKVIGYDASPKDRKRFAHAVGMQDPKYAYEYPLIDWGWEREYCKEVISRAGLPVPCKSACFFCPASKPQEIRELKRNYLRRIVIMEARAKPRLMGCWDQSQIDAYNAETYERRLDKWEAKGMVTARPEPYKVGDGTAGLWRSATKTRPAMITDFILSEGLLPEEEVRMLQDRAPKEIIDSLQAFANGELIPSWHDFLEQFTEEDAIEELPGHCVGCHLKK